MDGAAVEVAGIEQRHGAAFGFLAQGVLESEVHDAAGGDGHAQRGKAGAKAVHGFLGRGVAGCGGDVDELLRVVRLTRLTAPSPIRWAREIRCGEGMQCGRPYRQVGCPQGQVTCTTNQVYGPRHQVRGHRQEGTCERRKVPSSRVKVPGSRQKVTGNFRQAGCTRQDVPCPLRQVSGPGKEGTGARR